MSRRSLTAPAIAGSLYEYQYWYRDESNNDDAPAVVGRLRLWLRRHNKTDNFMHKANDKTRSLLAHHR